MASLACYVERGDTIVSQRGVVWWVITTAQMIWSCVGNYLSFPSDQLPTQLQITCAACFGKLIRFGPSPLTLPRISSRRHSLWSQQRDPKSVYVKKPFLIPASFFSPQPALLFACTCGVFFRASLAEKRPRT
jgi:hypothetical protein